jgi:hypothetical protein
MATSITAVDADNIRPGTAGTVALDKEIAMASLAVGNGTLYITTVRDASNTDPQGVGTCYAPMSATPPARQLRLTSAFGSTGVPLTASAPSGGFGISRTAGTSLVLSAEATSSNTKTDTVNFEFVLPDTYVAGAALPIVIDANYTGSGTVTTTSIECKVSLMGVTGAQTVVYDSTQAGPTATATHYTFNVPVADTVNFVPGSVIQLTITMIVTTSAGALTGQINSVKFVA